MKYIWLVFAVMFFCMALVHAAESTKRLPLAKNKGGIKSVAGVTVGHSEFVSDFNKRVEAMNQANRRSNILAATGYGVTSLTAVFSYFLA